MAERMAGAQFTRRRVALALRDGRTVRGNIHVIEKQSLVQYLTTRRFFVNLTEAQWGMQGGPTMPHVAVRSDHVYWANTDDPELPVSSHVRPAFRPRWAELILDDGVAVHVALYIAEEQRLTDYMDAASGFLPILEARIVATAERLGEIAINTGAVLAIREIDPPTD
jgi:hypothetical protein